MPAIGIAIACPLYILVFTRPDWKLAAGLLLIPGVFHYIYLGPTFGVIQNTVDTRRRATATALLFFVLNFIALGVRAAVLRLDHRPVQRPSVRGQRTWATSSRCARAASA